MVRELNPSPRVIARFLSPLLLLSVISLGLIGCGGIIATPTLNDAEAAVRAAELERADELATYEFVSAVEYLEMAKQEWGQSDWQAADEYAERAILHAEAALSRATARSRGGATPVTEADDASTQADSP
ncbi:MAG: DUF4398 domain-containing protein [Myxococcales bacterium]|nr:DUF4398 domain-containing protein [Myxococcales bacterium]